MWPRLAAAEGAPAVRRVWDERLRWYLRWSWGVVAVVGLEAVLGVEPGRFVAGLGVKRLEKGLLLNGMVVSGEVWVLMWWLLL